MTTPESGEITQVHQAATDAKAITKVHRKQVDFDDYGEISQPITIPKHLNAEYVPTHPFALPQRTSLIYLVGIFLAEYVANIVNPLGGLVIHSVLLVALILHSAVAEPDSLQRFLLSLSIVPMIRLLSFGLPLYSFEQIYWYLIVSVPLFIVIYGVARNLNFSANYLGLNLNKPLWQLAFILSGIPFGIAEYFILRPERLVSPFSWPLLIMAALILLVCTGLLEELLFRGVLFQSSRAVMNDVYTVLYTALLFAIMHIGYQSILDVVMVFGAGLVWGGMALKTQSLFGISIAHGLTNIILFLVMPYLMG